MMVGAGRARVLGWEGCLNARDLGGYPTADGRETRWGAVVRMDNPGRLSAAGRDAVVAYGVRTIVDLRRPAEVAEHPNPFAEPGDHGIAYHHRTFEDPQSELPPLPTMADDYLRSLDQFGTYVAAIMSAIAAAPEGGVMIHCMGGRDRTGLVSAMLLDLAGVPRATIGEDYALSSQCLRPETEKWLENGPGERADREREIAHYWTHDAVMLAALAHLDERHGGVAAYLTGAGVPDADVERLRARLVDVNV